MLLQVSGSKAVGYSVCVSVCGGEECVHIRGNERDELMTICPLSCP